jgi:[ribosomal protein S18]-alanine N-acetyltransferase
MTPDELARLHASAFAQDRPWSAGEFASLLPLPGVLLLGDRRAVLLGRLILDEAEILTLATDPAHRRQGLAGALLLRFEEETRARAGTLSSATSRKACVTPRALYEGHGYREVGRRPAYYARPRAPVAALVLARAI